MIFAIILKKLLFLGRLIKEPEMSPAVKSLFDTRTKASLPPILHHWVFCQSLQRHYINMSCLITLKIDMIALHFQITIDGKKIVRDKICDFERHARDSFCESHPDMWVAHSCLENVPPFCIWSLTDQLPDLVSRLQVQV